MGCCAFSLFVGLVFIPTQHSTTARNGKSSMRALDRRQHVCVVLREHWWAVRHESLQLGAVEIARFAEGGIVVRGREEEGWGSYRCRGSRVQVGYCAVSII